MLDECIGDRFEEILAVFSTVVLRRVVLAQDSRHREVAGRLATSEYVSLEEQKSFLPLVCAHRASLSSLLRRKAVLRSHYEDFAQSLVSKAEQIEERNEQFKAASAERNCQDDIRASETEVLRSLVQENWYGEAGWVELVVGGRTRRGHDALLESKFTEVFGHVGSGTARCIGDGIERGLLEDLESRANGQKERLRRWSQFRDDLKTMGTAPNSSEVVNNPGQSAFGRINLRFEDHQHLIPGGVGAVGGVPSKDSESCNGDSKPSTTSIEYNHLIAKLRQELLNVPKARPRAVQGWRKLLTDDSSSNEEEDLSVPKSRKQVLRDSERVFDKKRLSDGTTCRLRIPLEQDKQGIRGRAEVKHTISDHEHGKDELPWQTGAITSEDEDSTVKAKTRYVMFVPAITCPNKILQPDFGKKRTEEVRLSTSEIGKQELLVEAIVSSVIEAAPSPVKPRPSLAERTRMSMALSSSHHFHQTMMMGPPPPPTPLTEEPLKLGAPKGLMDVDRRTTLTERTRQSMFMLPATAHKIRKSNYHLQASKGYPVNQFETPRKQPPRHIDEEGKDSTPPEELFSREADYASVFKSRPKITISPTVSLSLGTEGPSVLDDIAEQASDDSSWESSPLVRG